MGDAILPLPAYSEIIIDPMKKYQCESKVN